MSRKATKDEILEMYLNAVPLGQRGSFAIVGVSEAARLFFGKDVANLTIADVERNTHGFRLDHNAEKTETNEWIKRLGVVTAGTEAPISTLSGGNQQKVMMARSFRLSPKVLLVDEPTQGVDIGAKEEIHAFMKRVPANVIVVLDEATSALDAESEHLVKEALDRLMRGRTTLVIAHRLSTVRDADRVIVLDRGRIAESGTHDDLMKNDGPYKKLVERQLAG